MIVINDTLPAGQIDRPANFGRALRTEWNLARDAIFLNHGSFGACPRWVTNQYHALQKVMASAPDRFIEDRIMPMKGMTDLRMALGEAARFLGTSHTSCAFIENATVGIQAVLNSLELAPDDIILLTNHQYPAVRLAVEERCRRAGATVRTVQISLSSDPDEIVETIDQAAAGSVKLAIIDHITSPTAILFPVQRIVRMLQARAIPILIDGAHAIGQIDVGVEKIGAEWYVTNAHKWLYGWPGTGILHASDTAKEKTRPLVTSHFVDQGFPTAFDYVGTRDYCAWLAMPYAISFFERLGPASLRDHCVRLLLAASQHLGGIGVEPASPFSSGLAMKSFVLPQHRPAEADDAMRLKINLWEEARIQIAAAAFEGQLLLRISAQAYVETEDFAALAKALDTLGWPGRA